MLRFLFSLVRRVRRVLFRILLRLLRFSFFRPLKHIMIRKLIYYHIANPEDAADVLKYFPYKKDPKGLETLEEFAQKLRDMEGKEYFFLAKFRGNVVGKGAITWYPSRKTTNQWTFSSFWVNPQYRRLGIGEGILSLAIKKCIEMGATEIVLSVFDHLKPAINLYRKMGFQHVSSMEHATNSSEKKLVHIFKYSPHLQE